MPVVGLPLPFLLAQIRLWCVCVCQTLSFISQERPFCFEAKSLLELRAQVRLWTENPRGRMTSVCPTTSGLFIWVLGMQFGS